MNSGCRRQIEKSPLAQIEISRSRVSVGEQWADDGDYGETHVHSHHVDLAGRLSAAMQHDIASTNGHLDPVMERGSLWPAELKTRA